LCNESLFGEKDMEKIAIIGTHGVGKTKLANALKSFLLKKGKKVELVEEVVRKSPLPINEFQTIKTTLWIVLEQIQDEILAESKNPDYIICDRSVIDPLIYQLYRDEKSHLNIDKLSSYVYEYQSTYDKIFIVLPSDKPIIGDGVRSTDKDLQIEIDRLFRSDWYYDMNKVEKIIPEEIFDLDINLLCAHITSKPTPSKINFKKSKK
jgi:hypothetical protein